MKKSDYRILVAGLREELDLAKDRSYSLAQQIKDMPEKIEDIKRERDEWRVKYEQVLLTPEVKADTEAAFKRGENHARTKLSAWLVQTAQGLVTESDEV